MKFYKSYIYYIGFPLTILGCKGQGESSSAKGIPSSDTVKNVQKDSLVTEKQDDQKIKKNIASYEMRNSIGLLVAAGSDQLEKPLLFYNENEEVWAMAAFEGNYKKQLSQLTPFAIDDEAYFLILNCLGRANGYYKVVVNEKIKEAKYIREDDSAFKLQTWEEHIVGCFSVDFDQVANPIKAEPLSTAKTIAYVKDEFYHPVKIQGNWLLVKWGTEAKYIYGWIRWKEGTTLIIELFYFA